MYTGERWRQLWLLVTIVGVLLFRSPGFAQDFSEDLLGEDDPFLTEPQIADPLEPLNRVFFVFNDKLYFWALKPVAKVYSSVLAEDVRMCIRNAFKNLLSPVRIVNNLLQGKVKDSGKEVARFFLNTLLGAGGLADPANDVFGLDPRREDLGQTFGRWGAGEGVYLCWPFLGPSNVRDSLGFAGDIFLNPLTHVSLPSSEVRIAIQSIQKVNSLSLVPGEYEEFKESTFDPYTAMRDFYTQSRRSKIADKVRHDDSYRD